MTHSPVFRALLSMVLLTAALFAAAMAKVAGAAETLDQRVNAAVAVLAGAENRFRSPDPHWFETTRRALQEETERVDLALNAEGAEYAEAWKKLLRWPLLTSNLGSPSEINYAELALVRRWLFSNNEGLEYPFFAPLRKTMESHLDAAFALTHLDLQADFRQQVAMARQQILALPADPSDARAAALGRTLGWFERTKQLPSETATVRALLSTPSAQIVLAKPLLDRAIGLLVSDVSQSLPVTDRVVIPGNGLFAKSRTANVRGTAHTQGRIALELATNRAVAELRLVYRGVVESHCRAAIGPVTVGMQTNGTVRAVTPVQLSLLGVKPLTTQVSPQVRTRVTSVSAQKKLVRRIGNRRVHEPASLRQMNDRASSTTASMIQKEMNARVVKTLAEIRAELQKTKVSLDSLPDVLAPIVREGAAPEWHGFESTAKSIYINGGSPRCEQFGTVNRCPSMGSADVQFRFHVSFFNNMAETIMAGKTFTDKYFMNYGRILQAELPPTLMVHSRAVRWAIVAAKPRPLEITIPAPNQFRIQLRMQQVNIGDEQFAGPITATVHYTFQKDEFDEYQLKRQGDVELNASMPEASQEFLSKKLSAFFAPILNAGGVSLPEGESLKRLSSLKPKDAIIDRDWLVLGVDVPTEVLQQWMP